jgi:hypothetical protein
MPSPGNISSLAKRSGRLAAGAASTRAASMARRRNRCLLFIAPPRVVVKAFYTVLQEKSE